MVLQMVDRMVCSKDVSSEMIKVDKWVAHLVLLMAGRVADS
jgi:hypothetical protein